MLQKVHFNGFLLPQGRGVIAAASSSSTHLLVLNSDSYSPRVMKAVWDQCGKQQPSIHRTRKLPL